MKINNRTFYNTNENFEKNFAVSVFQFNDTINQLTFDELVLNQIENIEQIRELKFHNFLKRIYSTISLIPIIIITTVYVIMYILHVKIKNLFEILMI